MIGGSSPANTFPKFLIQRRGAKVTKLASGREYSAMMLKMPADYYYVFLYKLTKDGLDVMEIDSCMGVLSKFKATRTFRKHVRRYKLVEIEH